MLVLFDYQRYWHHPLQQQHYSATNKIIIKRLVLEHVYRGCGDVPKCFNELLVQVVKFWESKDVRVGKGHTESIQANVTEYH